MIKSNMAAVDDIFITLQSHHVRLGLNLIYYYIYWHRTLKKIDKKIGFALSCLQMNFIVTLFY